ncbi:MAG: TVP38/TMEM64 family protein [bacterium]|nr:TVP38/TMEM64 family protein [bacterium]
MDKRAITKLILLILGLVLLVILFRATGLSNYFNVTSLQKYIASFGIWSPIMFLLISTIRPLTLFPGTILTIVAGLLFGIFWGTIYATLGATFSAMFAFGLARKLGREAVIRFIPGRMTQFDEKVATHGFWVILILRLVPVIIPSFYAVNFAAGLSKIRFWDFTFGTALGLIPGTLFLVAVTAAITTPKSPQFWIPILLWILFLIVALSYLNQKRKQGWTLFQS